MHGNPPSEIRNSKMQGGKEEGVDIEERGEAGIMGKKGAKEAIEATYIMT